MSAAAKFIAHSFAAAGFVLNLEALLGREETIMRKRKQLVHPRGSGWSVAVIARLIHFVPPQADLRRLRRRRAGASI